MHKWRSCTLSWAIWKGFPALSELYCVIFIATLQLQHQKAQNNYDSPRVTLAWRGPSFKWKFNLGLMNGVLSYRLIMPATHRCSCLQIVWIWAMFNKCSWCPKNVHCGNPMFTMAAWCSKCPKEQYVRRPGTANPGVFMENEESGDQEEEKSWHSVKFCAFINWLNRM